MTLFRNEFLRLARMLRTALSSGIVICFAGSAINVADAAPSQFPTGVTIHKKAKAFPGLTLFNFMADKKIFLVDMEGNVVNTWDYPEGNRFGPLGFPLSNGRLLAHCGSSIGRGLCELDWSGNVTWSFYREDLGMNHDFERIASTRTTLALAKVDAYMPWIAPYYIRDDRIIEITKSGDVIWSWSAGEHFMDLDISEEGRDEIYFKQQHYADKTDIFHTNSIQRLPTNKHQKNDDRFKQGHILVSQRTTSKVFIIDRSTGELVWKLDDCIDDVFRTIGQHHASMIPRWLPGDGNILLYDNGSVGRYPAEFRFYSRVVEIDPITCKVKWQYNAEKNSTTKQAFFSNSRGSAQRLPNGNTLITEPLWLRIFEVTEEGEIVWEYVHPGSKPADWVRKTENIYRAYRVAPGWGTTETWPDPSGNRHFTW